MRAPRWYVALWLVLAWSGVLLGFGPNVAKVAAGTLHRPGWMVLHGVVFFGWLTLLTAQLALVQGRRVEWHRRLGQWALGYAVVVVVMGLTAAFFSTRASLAASSSNEGAQFSFHLLVDMTVFSTGFTLAMRHRSDPGTHRRWLMLGATFILGAGFGRAVGPWLGPWLERLGDDPFMVGYLVTSYGGVDLLLALGVVADLTTTGRVHRVNALGVPALLAAQLLSATVVNHVPLWGEWVRRALG